MNYTEHKITLDVHDAMSRVVLRMKKGDSRRRLRVHLSENGYPYHISEDCYAVFTALKPDGKVVFNNCSIDGCAVIYDVTEQTTAAEGVLNCEIQVYGAENGLLTSACFTIVVENTVYDKETEVESASEFNALTDLFSKIQKLKKELENKHKSGLPLPAVNLLVTVLSECATYSNQTANIEALRMMLIPTDESTDGINQSENILTITSGVIAVQNGNTLIVL